MQFGFGAPTSGPLAEAETLARIARAGEEMGFGYLTVSDHIVIPTDIQARYPYSESGEFPATARAGRHEQLIEIAFLAARTSRIRLVTSVMVVPHRPAVLTAKLLSTIDVLSGGRLALGIGAGWLTEEFSAIGTPPFAERGAVTDEYLDAFRALWTQETPCFAGKYVKFSDIVFEPKPAQKPHPPIWVGGESAPSMRRAARIGDAWYPIGTNPAHPLDSLKRLSAAIARLRTMAEAAGRDPASVGVVYRVARMGPELSPKASDGERRLFSGTQADIAGDLRDLRALGVGHVDFGFTGTTEAEMLGGMKRFRDDVLAKV